MERTILYAVLLASALAITVSAQRPAQRRFIKSADPQLANLPFSSGALVGDTFYVGGHIGTDPKTSQAPKDVEQEIRFLLDGFKDTLAKGSMTMDELVTVTVFCSDLSLYEKFNAIYRTYFTKDFPARAFIGAKEILAGGRFEMVGIAVKR